MCRGVPQLGAHPAVRSELPLVEEAFEVPLPFLMDRGNERAGVRQYQGREIPTIEFHFAGHRIWGATANMLIELRKIIENQ